MAVRIRKDKKTIVCAAEFPAEEGDCYLDDGVHYCLAVKMGILHTDDEGDNWYFDTTKKRFEEGKDEIKTD